MPKRKLKKSEQKSILGFFQLLPLEIVMYIFDSLTLPVFLKLCLVSKELKKMVDDIEEDWRRKITTEFSKKDVSYRYYYSKLLAFEQDVHDRHPNKFSYCMAQVVRQDHELPYRPFRTTEELQTFSEKLKEQKIDQEWRKEIAKDFPQEEPSFRGLYGRLFANRERKRNRTISQVLDDVLGNEKRFSKRMRKVIENENQNEMSSLKL